MTASCLNHFSWSPLHCESTPPINGEIPARFNLRSVCLLVYLKRMLFPSKDYSCSNVENYDPICR